MREHRLKTWPEFFNAIKRGDKTFDVRQDDRGFEVGDEVVLCEYDPCGAGRVGRFTGREMHFIITYKLPGGRFGIDANWCVLALGRGEPEVRPL